MPGVVVRFSVKELRSPMPCSQKSKKPRCARVHRHHTCTQTQGSLAPGDFIYVPKASIKDSGHYISKKILSEEAGIATSLCVHGRIICSHPSPPPTSQVGNASCILPPVSPGVKTWAKGLPNRMLLCVQWISLRAWTLMLFVSHNHHDEVSQTGWFIKITEMYSFTVLKAKNLKSRCHQSQAASKDSRLKFLFLFQVLVVARNLWWWLASGRIIPFSTSIFLGRLSTVYVCVQISLFFYKDTCHWIRAHPTPVWPCFNLLSSANTLFPIKAILTDPRWTWIQGKLITPVHTIRCKINKIEY